jgi:hypothetical protein
MQFVAVVVNVQPLTPVVITPPAASCAEIIAPGDPEEGVRTPLENASLKT